MNKIENFIKNCIDNNLTIFEIQLLLKENNNEQFSDFLGIKDFCNFKIEQFYKLQISDDENLIDYCRVLCEFGKPIYQLRDDRRKIVTINNAISYYIKCIKYK